MNKIIITAILTTLILISFGVNNVSADAWLDRYYKGISDAKTSIGDITTQLELLGGQSFPPHSDAYKNGYIAGIDQKYNLYLPYYNWETGSMDNMQGSYTVIAHTQDFHQ